MADNDFNIILKDETDGERMSRVDVEQEAAQAATKPNTSVLKNPINEIKAAKNAAKSFGTGVANIATGGLYGQATEVIGNLKGTAAPLAIAAVAITAAKQIIEYIIEIQRLQQEQRRNGFRAGGAYRTTGNLINSRATITGKIVGQQTEYRR